MIEVPDHLGLVQWEPDLVAFNEAVPHQRETVGQKLFPRAEEVGVVGHLEHGEERYAPRVLAHGLVDQHRDALVDGAGQRRVCRGSEDGTSTCIRVDER